MHFLLNVNVYILSKNVVDIKKTYIQINCSNVENENSYQLTLTFQKISKTSITVHVTEKNLTVSLSQLHLKTIVL